MNVLLLIIFANILISLISLVGVIALAVRHKYNPRITQLIVSFAAGVLLSSALLTVLNEALIEGDIFIVLTVVLFGMTFSFLLERFLLWHHHHDNTHKIHPSAILVILGDGLHNFIDGVAIAATFIASPALGIATTFAIAAHEIPQEIADFSILTHSGFSKKRALFYNFLSALTAVFGGIFGYFFLQESSFILPYALAITAGIFIYIAAADLIPALHEDKSELTPIAQVIPFLIGVILIYCLATSIVHSG